MKMKNMLIGGMSLALVACISVGATLAYLTATTGPVVNTFTMGDGIALELKEHIWNDGENYNAKENEWITDNGEHTQWDNPTVWDKTNVYTDVVPGMVLPKDPTVKLASSPKAGAEVYVLVNGINDTYMDVEIDEDNWTSVTDQTGTGKNGIYQYTGDALVAGNTEDAYAEFFSEVTFKDQNWTTNPGEQNIVLYAFACQKTDLLDEEGNPTTPTVEAVKALNKAANTDYKVLSE